MTAPTLGFFRWLLFLAVGSLIVLSITFRKHIKDMFYRRCEIPMSGEAERVMGLGGVGKDDMKAENTKKGTNDVKMDGTKK